jgi:predicted MPP superfamily phosphohydrolase
MGFRRFLPSSVLLTALALASGCGDDAPASPDVRLIAPASESTSNEIPREQLYGASTAENLWMPRYEMEMPSLPAGWNGVRIAVLSDFHLGYWSENQAVAGEAVRRAIESQADLIVMLGDYVDGRDDLPALEQVLAPLRGRPTVAVLGDRDVRSDSLAAAITSVLQDHGVAVLRNSSMGIEFRGDTAWVAGLDPDILNESFANQQYILATLGHPGRTPILLSHVPTLATRAPQGRFPLVISGNTFCGSVEIPLASRLSWLATQALPGGAVEGVEKAFRVQGGNVLVSCGLGYGFVPIRFGAAPEIPLLTLGSGSAGADITSIDAGAVADSLIRSYEGSPE